MNGNQIAVFSALVLSGSVALNALAASDPAEPGIADGGMVLVTEDRRGAIYADPDVDWSVYEAILLDDATVAFRKNWQRDQNRASRTQRIQTRDIERIKNDLAEQFGEVFSAELENRGDFAMADTPAANVLRITPYIVDLDIYAPDVPSATYSRSYTDSAGRMTLKLELYDSETGDLIAVASDHREAPHRGYAQWTTRISNRADARQMFQQWAKALNERLLEASGKS